MTGPALTHIMILRLAFVCFALPGCAVIVIDYGSFPSDEALGKIEPGHSSRADVLAALGPPEDYRSPAPGEGSRSFSPVKTRIVEERRVFELDDMTYVRETRVERILYLVLFTLRRSESQADQLVITFDDVGRVKNVARSGARDGHED